MKSDDTARPIGGFFGLSIDQIPPVSGSVWREWVRHYAAAAMFGTARAALGALITAAAPKRVWLPAYLCREASDAVADAVRKIPGEISYYPLDDDLEPKLDFLDERVLAAELVLVVDFFGWPPGEGFRRRAGERPDIIWVEDRAQTLWTADSPWAPWCILSPRKLLGVPNGGILLGSALPTTIEPITTGPNLTVALPELMRFEDTDQSQNEIWYAAYQDREAAFEKTSAPISQLTRSLLERVPITPIIAARQRNYRYLLARLQQLGAWPRESDHVAPFGFVIAVDDAEMLARRLAQERLFCARHWARIASDGASFPFEHGLSRKLLTLPCDHRYNQTDMERLADAVERLAPNPATFRRGV